MTSTGLYWLATSERERERALEVARALKQKESRDEIGLGAVRDALADRLFPGTSTLHTRARYHLFVPWAYQAAAERIGRGTSPAAAVREAEARLIAALRQSGESRGVIGRTAGQALKRMPSELYWQGLRVWGIRRVGGSQRAVERMLATGRGPVARDENGDPLDGPDATVWHPNLPAPPADHPAGATFALTDEEADFLLERLRVEPATRSSALPPLAAIAGGHVAVKQIWEHPARGRLASDLQRTIEQGRRFSLLMHGASWLYNVVLAEQRGSGDLAEEHRGALAEWAADATADADVLASWDLDELWTLVGPRVSPTTRAFVGRWRRMLVEHGADQLVGRDDARRLVIAREQAMKGRNARSVNHKALEQWGGYSGTAPLDFRWSTARVLLDDLHRASGGGQNAEDR